MSENLKTKPESEWKDGECLTLGCKRRVMKNSEYCTILHCIRTLNLSNH